jgi:hypothetical protein
MTSSSSRKNPTCVEDYIIKDCNVDSTLYEREGEYYRLMVSPYGGDER